MKNQSRVGAQKERDLVKDLCENGYPALRMAASGAGTTRDLPDILCRVDGGVLAGEAKYTTKDYAYVQADEVAALEAFCAVWGFIPVALARFSQDTTWYVVPVRSGTFEEDLTSSGNLSMKRSRTNRYTPLYRYLEYLERATT